MFVSMKNTMWLMSLSAAGLRVHVTTCLWGLWFEGMIYLCCLGLLVQQRQSCQVFQERVGRIKNLGQKIEAFPFIVVQNLDKKKGRKNNYKQTGHVMSVAYNTSILTEPFTLPAIYCSYCASYCGAHVLNSYFLLNNSNSWTSYRVIVKLTKKEKWVTLFLKVLCICH